MGRFRILSCSILAAFVLAGCVKIAPLITPEFEVPVADQKQIHNAIHSALIQRKWAILKNQPNAIEAQYSRGHEHSARIRVSHAGRKVKISLVNSENMQYSQKATGPFIHKWYNTWVQNLERDIQRAIGTTL
jgi:hypothetical protein